MQRWAACRGAPAMRQTSGHCEEDRLMESYVVEWLNILGRWVHFVTGIAWIGSSFYFIWLDNHLQQETTL